jgi:hypothetical protein
MMYRWTAALIVLLFSSQSYGYLPSELNKCKPRLEKGKTEEQIAREAAEGANLSDHEVFGRLILSESLASGILTKRCNASNIGVLMEAIAWAVINRVQKLSPDKEDPKPDAFYNVIFEARQFRTSFSSASTNPFSKIFLCPTEAKIYTAPGETGLDAALALYKQAKEVAARVMEVYQKSGIPAERLKVSNYYLPYSEVNAERPKWAKDPDPTKNKGYVDVLKVTDKPCAEFYRAK